MIVTQVQRFVYSLIALMLTTLFLLVLLNSYSVEIFIVLLIIEFLIVVELTESFHFKAAWRRNIIFIILFCIIIFSLIIYNESFRNMRQDVTACIAMNVTYRFLCRRCSNSLLNSHFRRIFESCQAPSCIFFVRKFMYLIHIIVRKGIKRMMLPIFYSKLFHRYYFLIVMLCPIYLHFTKYW